VNVCLWILEQSKSLNKLRVAGTREGQGSCSRSSIPQSEGLAIYNHRFRARAWKTILTSCNIEYQTPSKLQSSAVFHTLDRGVNPTALAEQTGHYRRVLLSTDTHAIVVRRRASFDRAVLSMSINDRNYAAL
jgi:hypothetical protein